ncbi:MAG: c-type cytochrome [Acidimicrobiales bacterium]
MLIAASTQTSVGVVIILVAMVVAITYGLINLRQAKPEVGSEIELAPNRKRYYSDEELEGSKLDRTLTFGLLGLFVVGIGLPLYWLQEPGRQGNESGDLERKFVDRGANMFATTEKGGFNCAFCHGEKGVGGATPYTLTDAEGRFVKQVTWKGPALNTVLLRYSRDEVRYVLEYGRPFSPMPAWGAKGGGPLTEQNLQNLIDYLTSIQLTPKQSQKQYDTELAKMMKDPDQTCVATRTEAAKAALSTKEQATFDPTSVDTSSCPKQWKSKGEAGANMGYYDGFAGGAYSCGRCHTKGWSYGDRQTELGGAFGPPLTNVRQQFPGGSLGVTQQTDFVCKGSENGARYGQNGQGSGRMPGFCITPEVKLNPENGEVGVKPQDSGLPEDGAMISQDQVRSIVEYERSLTR